MRTNCASTVQDLWAVNSALWHCTRPSLTAASVPRHWQRNTASVGTPTDYLDGSRGFVNHDGRGMEFDHYPEHKKFTLSWTQVEKYIDLMIQSDRYLTDKEKEHYTPSVPITVEPDTTLTHAKNLIREFLSGGVRLRDGLFRPVQDRHCLHPRHR